MPFDSTEQKLDTHNAHTSENKTIDATHQIKHRESREAELRDAFRKADFSERAGTPAERLAIMSKAANDLTRERAEVAAAKQKEEDAGFWESERSKSNDSAPTEKDTTIKPAPIAIEQKKEAAPKQADIKSSDNIDIKSSDKIDIKSDSKPASPKSPKAKELKRTHDDDDDHWSDMPSERRSKLDRRADENIPSDIAAQAEAEHKERVAKEKAEPARQLDWTPAGEEEHLNRQLAERKQWQAKYGREIDDPDNHTNTGARPTLREELAHHSARIWGTVGQSDKEHHIPTATHVPAKLELHSKELDRRALRGDDDAIIEQKRSISTTTAPTLTGKLSEAKSSIGAKLHDAKELVEDKLEAAEDKLAHWKDEAVEKLTHAKDKAVEIKDDAVSKATELRDDASAKATEIKRDAISKKDEISRDIDIKRAEISRDVDSKRKEISRDIDSKRAEIGRDIDSKRAELRGKADSIDRDIRSRSAELKADAKDATSTIRAQAHTISDDVKAEVRDDIAAVKAKMNELGRSITHKKDELKADIQQRDPTHHREIDMSNRRSGVIVEEKPAGLMDKVSSWWSGNKQEQHETTLATGATGTLFPAHRWSRDPDAKDMQAKLEELRAAEGTQRTPMRGHDSTFAGGVRSQLSQGWQHIKTDLKPSGKKDIEEHDWVDQADKASAFDIDNAPSSPRSWASSSPRSPASPIQRSASPVSYRARSASPVAIQQEGGFFSGFDPTVMDACVEPW